MFGVTRVWVQRIILISIVSLEPENPLVLQLPRFCVQAPCALSLLLCAREGGTS